MCLDDPLTEDGIRAGSRNVVFFKTFYTIDKIKKGDYDTEVRYFILARHLIKGAEKFCESL